MKGTTLTAANAVLLRQPVHGRRPRTTAAVARPANTCWASAPAPTCCASRAERNSCCKPKCCKISLHEKALCKAQSAASRGLLQQTAANSCASGPDLLRSRAGQLRPPPCCRNVRRSLRADELSRPRVGPPNATSP